MTEVLIDRWFGQVSDQLGHQAGDVLPDLRQNRVEGVAGTLGRAPVPVTGDGRHRAGGATDRVHVVRRAQRIESGHGGQRGQYLDQGRVARASVGPVLVRSPSSAMPTLPALNPPTWAALTIDGRGPTRRGPKTGTESMPGVAALVHGALLVDQQVVADVARSPW